MTLPNVLYHGTNASLLDAIKRDGLLPRRELKHRGNWNHSVESNPDAVYLTDAYPFHFAAAARNAKRQHDLGTGLLLEIDTTMLYRHLICPDEDVLEQGTRKQERTEDLFFLASTSWDMKKRTRHYRKFASSLSHLAEFSLQHMGTCAYYNDIPWSAVTRYVIVDWDKLSSPIKWNAVDTMVSIANYHILQDRHKALVRWFFGDKVEVDDLFMTLAIDARLIAASKDDPEAARMFANYEERRQQCIAAAANRDGVTVHYLGVNTLGEKYDAEA